MKTRNGFISNSSSSCFIALIPENELENLDMNPIEKTVMKLLSEETTFCDIPCVKYVSYTGNVSSFGEYSEIREDQIREILREIDPEGPIPEDEDDLMDNIWVAQDSLKEKIKKLETRVFTEGVNL